MSDPLAPTGAAVGLSGGSPTKTRTIADLVADSGYLRDRTKILVEDSSQLHEDTARLHGETLDELLRTAAAEHARRPLTDLLERLSEAGFSWRDVARVAGVSVPALRKWRAGENATGENHRRVAELVAFSEIVGEQYLGSDVPRWLEVPLVRDVPVTGLDLLVANRFDLLFRWASGTDVDPESLLDDYDPAWRGAYATEIETFAAPDGQPALRVRSD